jgi:hypothetical protein
MRRCDVLGGGGGGVAAGMRQRNKVAAGLLSLFVSLARRVLCATPDAREPPSHASWHAPQASSLRQVCGVPPALGGEPESFAGASSDEVPPSFALPGAGALCL